MKLGLKKLLYISIFFIVIVLSVVGYVGLNRILYPGSVATYRGKNITIKIKVQKTHRYLPEYDRFLIVHSNGEERTQRMFKDSGGYSDVNLYKKSKNIYFLDGYFDAYLVNTNKLTIKDVSRASRESFQKGSYIGGFKWVGQWDAWKFLPADKLSERKLEPKGG